PASVSPSLYPLSLHDALPILRRCERGAACLGRAVPRQARVLVAYVCRARVPAADPARDAARAASLPRRSEAPHPVSGDPPDDGRSEEHTSELQSRFDLVCRLL